MAEACRLGEDQHALGWRGDAGGISGRLASARAAATVRKAFMAGFCHAAIAHRSMAIARAGWGLAPIMAANLHLEPAMSDLRPRPVPRHPRPARATLTCKSWLSEAPYRMLQNNLDAEVAEDPASLVVYGGIGRAARDWKSYETILSVLKRLDEEHTLLVQSGKPVGVFRTHADAPRVLIANSNLVPRWASWEHFSELDRKGLMMYGQMTAGSWIYIGSQGIVQGTYETFVEMGRQHYGGDLTGRWILTAGLGGMGGAQPLAACGGTDPCAALLDHVSHAAPGSRGGMRAGKTPGINPAYERPVDASGSSA